MSAAEVAATVVGGGIAGLAAALDLQQRVGEVVVIEAGDRPGGVLRTDHVSGYVIERGPNTVQIKAPMLSFLRRWSLESRLVRARPASRLRFVYHHGALQPVPLSPWAFAGSSLLSPRAKLRLLLEPFVGRGPGGEESVAEFTTRRLGREVTEHLVGPFLTGVYAGDERELGAESVFGSLVELERAHRSLAWGALRQALRRGRPRGLPGSWSAPEGLGPFARELAARLKEPMALGSRVVALGREAGAWRVEVESEGGQSVLRSRLLVLAGSAPESAQLLSGACPEAAELLSGIRYAPIASLALGVDPGAVRTRIEGFGFLVPRAAGLRLLGCLYMSQLFADRAPAGRELLQCMIGGERWPQALELSDEDLEARVREDLDRVLGLDAAPQRLAVTRWPRAIPQPDRSHAARIRAVRARLGAEAPGLALAGAYLDGVSVADSLASGLRAARELGPDESSSRPA